MRLLEGGKKTPSHRVARNNPGKAERPLSERFFLRSLAGVWYRPVTLMTEIEGKGGHDKYHKIL